MTYAFVHGPQRAIADRITPKDALGSALRHIPEARKSRKSDILLQIREDRSEEYITVDPEAWPMVSSWIKAVNVAVVSSLRKSLIMKSDMLNN